MKMRFVNLIINIAIQTLILRVGMVNINVLKIYPESGFVKEIMTSLFK